MMYLGMMGMIQHSKETFIKEFEHHSSLRNYFQILPKSKYLQRRDLPMCQENWYCMITESVEQFRLRLVTKVYQIVTSLTQESTVKYQLYMMRKDK